MIHDIIVTRLKNNCVFMMSDGRLGIANGSIVEGDEIVLFSGFRLPMVIRRQGRHGREGTPKYQLISPAFVEHHAWGKIAK